MTLYDDLFDLIRHYFEDHISDLRTIIVHLTAGMNDPTVKDPEESDEGFLSGLWSTMFSISVQLPHDHSWQDKLVDLLWTVENSPPPDRQPELGHWGFE